MHIMFKITLYTVGAIILAIVCFLIWFSLFYVQVPKLEIPQSTNSTEKTEIIDKWFANLHADHKFNGAVLITKDSKPVLMNTYGYTNHQLTTKLTTDSSFRLASLSKQFTASGIMLLKEQGQLDYDDLVSKHIANFPYEKVTIRHLLNQTSGVPDQYMELAETNKQNIKVLTNEKAVQLIIDNKPTQEYEANEKYEYSNTNYIILARIIEVISNQSFEKYMTDNIFDPLGMNNTRVWNLMSDDVTFNNKTDGFKTIPFKHTTKEMKPTFIDGVAGDGAVFSSVNDFVIWDKFWYGNELISDANLQEAFKKPTLNDGTKSNYGFGWGIVNDDVAMHNGSWLAARTAYIRNIKEKTSFVILDNSNNIFLSSIVEEIERIEGIDAK